MNELFMLMQMAGQRPETMGPLLDALGPQFSPDTVVPGLQSLAPGAQTNPFAPPAPTSVPPVTPPPGAGVGVGGLPQGGMAPPAPQDPLAMIMSMLAPTTGAPQAPPGAPQAPPGAPAPTGRPQAPPSITKPTAATPVFSGGVSGSQKAPELGAQMTTGGTPAQLLLQALLGGGRGGTPNPLRVPTLGALLAGGQ